MAFNASTIAPLNSNRSRKMCLFLAAISAIALGVDLALVHPFADAEILFWAVTFFLICVNFSKLGTDTEEDRLAHYSAFRLTLTFIIGLLMANSLVEIVFNIELSHSFILGNIKLLTAFAGNLVFLVSHYAFYYFGIEEKGRIGERLE